MHVEKLFLAKKIFPIAKRTIRTELRFDGGTCFVLHIEKD